MKKLRKWLQNQWRTLALWSAGILSSAYLLLTHLGSLTHGISHREMLLNQFSSSLQQIAHYPVGLPLHLVQWLFGALPFHTALWLRVPAVLFALSTLLCVTYIMRRWYGPRTALFGFLLFASSAWFLHVGRLATDDILLLWAIPVLLASHLVLHDYTDKKLAVFFWLAANLTLLYIPGMIWFVLANIILQWTDIREALAHHKAWLMRLSLFLTGLVLISPLAYGLAAGPTKEIGLKLLGAPTTMPQLQTIAENMRDAVLFIAIRGKAPADVWLNHLPVLGAFMTVAFVAGVLFYSKHWRASRTRLLSIFLLLGLALVSAGGAVTIGILVPLLYLIGAAGVAYLLHQWLVIFPRNPIARGFGIGLLTLTVMTACMYGLRQYFIAWPYHSETQAVFSVHKVQPSHR